MYGLGLIYIAQGLFYIEEDKNFELLCAKFPEKANEMRKDRTAKKEKDQEIREQHQRDMQVAEAGATKLTVNNYPCW